MNEERNKFTQLMTRLHLICCGILTVCGDRKPNAACMGRRQWQSAAMWPTCCQRRAASAGRRPRSWRRRRRVRRVYTSARGAWWWRERTLWCWSDGQCTTARRLRGRAAWTLSEGKGGTTGWGTHHGRTAVRARCMNVVWREERDNRVRDAPRQDGCEGALHEHCLKGREGQQGEGRTMAGRLPGHGAWTLSEGKIQHSYMISLLHLLIVRREKNILSSIHVVYSSFTKALLWPRVLLSVLLYIKKTCLYPSTPSKWCIILQIPLTDSGY